MKRYVEVEGVVRLTVELETTCDDEPLARPASAVVAAGIVVGSSPPEYRWPSTLTASPA